MVRTLSLAEESLYTRGTHGRNKQLGQHLEVAVLSLNHAINLFGLDPTDNEQYTLDALNQALQTLGSFIYPFPEG
ncbi:hypothetical protein LCGC14_1627000 [marine sediment metagenome]|uniref:Uncharacterized protein n=1 Tax=marine sediment metagenome TaxID=412755 RepID=A0A0F9I419_9ZZZZ